MMMILIKKRHMYFCSKLSFFLSLSLTPRSILSVVLSVNVLLIISVVCFCVFEKKCLLLLL